MTSIIATNEHNDIFATGGRLAMKRDAQAIAQLTHHVMSTRRGEMPYAKNRGIQYLENVFAGSVNLLVFESQARRAINRIPDVTSILAFDASLTNNVLSYSATIRTTFGTETINGTL